MNVFVNLLDVSPATAAAACGVRKRLVGWLDGDATSTALGGGRRSLSTT
jgi:hypothetical protein